MPVGYISVRIYIFVREEVCIYFYLCIFIRMIIYIYIYLYLFVRGEGSPLLRTTPIDTTVLGDTPSPVYIE